MKEKLKGFPFYAGARSLYHLLRYGETRSGTLLRLIRPEGLFQPYGTTTEDRYPVLFRLVRAELGDGPDLRLLSFGCSTGEEVFTLRHYFPQARITGIDISRARIAACRARLARSGADPGLSFRQAGSAAVERAESYDAVFAMAVFRHCDLDEKPPRCDHLVRFADFQQQVAALARCVKPGGLLAIRAANFRFLDTDVADGFDPIFHCPQHPRTPVYDRYNQRLEAISQEDALFRRRDPATSRSERHPIRV